MRRYLAHLSEDGREQTLEEHLNGTAELCRSFADAFHAGEYGYYAGLMHDIGKATDGFQKRLHGGPKVDHATAGAIVCAASNQLEMAEAVIGHHSGLPDAGNSRTDCAGDPTLAGRIKKGLKNNLLDTVDWNKGRIALKILDFDNDDFRRSMFCRMLYSCLVDADYLDTESFMYEGSVRTDTYTSLVELKNRLDAFTSNFENPKTELDQIRTDILHQCQNAGNCDKGLYSLTVPTGGGKTISSLSFALNHAVTHGMSRVIYVIPYTSIIEQTAEVFRKILGESCVLEHHSNAEFLEGEDGDPEKYRLTLSAENWDAPVIVTTSVQFFDSFFANRSSKCRKLHNVANSVIIFDEAQMIPSDHLLPCIAVIAELVKRFECTALLCTATQPSLQDLFRNSELKISEVYPNTEYLFEKLKRTTIVNKGKMDVNELAEELKNESQVLCIVNSRRTVQELYELLPVKGTYHLSTLMFPDHRRKVIAEIRTRLKEGKDCRVVSTSLIEAGVDLDFPKVYREKTGLDSILQAAGRCNREGRRKIEESIVNVFEGLSKTPMMLRVNIGAANEALESCDDLGSPETVRKYFDIYRSLIGNSIDKSGAYHHLKDGFNGGILPFEKVAEEFHLISDASKTVYIPMGDGADAIQKLLDGFGSKKIYRIAGRCGVSVYENQFDQLISSGKARMIDDSSAVLVDMELYNDKTGLKVFDLGEGGDGIFV